VALTPLLEVAALDQQPEIVLKIPRLLVLVVLVHKIQLMELDTIGLLVVAEFLV
jgi:hypothetical protein